MPTIYHEFEEVSIAVTPKGLKLTEEAGLECMKLKFRVEVDAESRETWHVANVWLVDYKFVSANRIDELRMPLEGDFGKEAEEFFYRSKTYGDVLQKKVDLAIIPPVSELYRDQREAGRGL